MLFDQLYTSFWFIHRYHFYQEIQT